MTTYHYGQYEIDSDAIDRLIVVDRRKLARLAAQARALDVKFTDSEKTLMDDSEAFLLGKSI